MATPRSQLIDLESTPFYHVTSRCVRRAFLTGQDHETGKNFSYRKAWVVERIKLLANVFGIDICAYAVMSNHYHIVLKVSHERIKSLSIDELLGRWEKVFPRDAARIRSMLLCASSSIINDIVNDLSEKLSDISWFMRCLNEYIAKKANKEDGVRGRFWDGRYYSQALLDNAAVLASMTYVDLNPIRAKTASTPENSDFTSIQDRIKAYTDVKVQPKHLVSLGLDKQSRPCNNAIYSTIDISLKEYLQLVDYMGRIVRADKRGSIPESLSPILERISVKKSGWMKFVGSIEKGFHYAVGSAQKIREFVPTLKKRRSKSLATAECCYI